MFYKKEPDNVLRFGDVLKGFINATPNLRKPISNGLTRDDRYNIEIDLPLFSVVISPCCSIGENILSLSPLIELRPTFFSNSYFVEDLTRINYEIEPEFSIPGQAWENLSAEEREKRLAVGRAYAFVGLFIYEKHDIFPAYSINRREGKIETNYYMIDFRNIYKINCNEIKSPQKAPLYSKCLQLSIKTRMELRNKLAFYFARKPKEDEILEG